MMAAVAASAALGWAYAGAWSASFYPQLLLLVRRDSPEGLSADFLVLNVFGFFCYSVYTLCFYSSTLAREQYRRKWGSDNLVQLNDVVFALHAMAVTGATLVVALVFRWRDQRRRSDPSRMALDREAVRDASDISVISDASDDNNVDVDGDTAGHTHWRPHGRLTQQSRHAPTPAIAPPDCTTGADPNLKPSTLTLNPQIPQHHQHQPFLSPWAFNFLSFSIFGTILLLIETFFSPLEFIDVLYFLSTIKMGVTLVKYMPQVVLNAKRQSTVGWSIGNILLDILGGVLSVAQTLVDAIAIDGTFAGITGNPVKFGLGIVSIFFDLIFIVQHYVLYAEWRQAHVEIRQSRASPVSNETTSLLGSSTDASSPVSSSPHDVD